MGIKREKDYTYLKIIEMLAPVDGNRMCHAACTVCGNIIFIRSSRILGKEQKSCGCLQSLVPRKDVTGKTINGILFLGYVGKSVWRVKYSCDHVGNSKPSLVKNKITSLCGKCSRAKPTTVKHGMSNSREYSSWNNMRRRCYDPNNVRSKFYSESGVKVCERWNNSFENFFADMGECPEGFSIERKDLRGDYCPSNCIWASDVTQANNKSNNILICNAYGEVWSLRRWCIILNLDYKNAWHLIRYKGVSVSVVLGDGFHLVERRKNVN